ncbi:MAG: hypothetical protein ACKESB_00580 [Candidatus Hodgkinia cicadicola]
MGEERGRGGVRGNVGRAKAKSKLWFLSARDRFVRYEHVKLGLVNG